MKKHYRILMVEDTEDDALLIMREVQKGDFDVHCERVETVAAFISALETQQWDIILCDYNLPTFNGIQALNILKERGDDIPFIIVSGKMGEERAVEAMKHGVNDYVMKGNLKRLLRVIERELKDSKIRKEHRHAEDARVEIEKKYRSLFETMSEGIVYEDHDGNIISANPAAERLLGISLDQMKGRTSLDPRWKAIHEDGSPFPRGTHSLRIAATTGVPSSNEIMGIYNPQSDAYIWLSVNAVPEFLPGEKQPFRAYAVFRDITERKQIEQKIIENEKRLNDVIFTVGDWVWEVDANGVYTYTSQMGTNLLGRTMEEIIGKTPFDFIVPYERKRVEKIFSEIVARKGHIKDLENWNVKKNGENICLQTNGVPILDKDGNLTGYRGVVTDITSRKMKEEALKESEERYSAIAQSANDAIITVNSKGEILKWNMGAEKIFGYTEKEMDGKELTKIIPQDLVEQHSNGIKRIEQGGEHHITGKTVELRGLHKNGKEFPLELSLAKWETSSGKYFTAIIRDITERKQSELQLLKLSQAIEQSPVSVVITDAQGTIEYVNKKFIDVTGYSFDEVLGENPRILNSGKTSSAEYKKMWEKLLNGDEWKGEFNNKKKNGEIFYESASISPIKDANGKITNFVAVKEDVTIRKTMEQEIRQMQRLEGLGTLAGGIAHDFNNILGIILAYSSLLGRGTMTKEKYNESIIAIDKDVRRGSALVRQILTFARKTDTTIAPLEIAKIVSEMISMLEQTFPKIITLEQVVESQIPIFSADQSQFHQALLNLCVNARDAMPMGGKITIAVSTLSREAIILKYPKANFDQYICIRVTDTGSGMDEITQSHIFDPFFTTKEQGKGTGLGLAVVYGVMQTHNGFIDVTSEIGVGTTFKMYFPVSQNKNAEVKDDTIVRSSTPGGNETILVVEDEEALRNIVTYVLSSNGYKVLSAQDGLEAVKIYQQRQNEIALVLTDMGLPKLTGEQEFKRLKQIDPQVVVVLASGFLEPDVKSELLKDGAKGFIQKPYNSDDVLRVIRDVLDSPKTS